MIVQLNLFRKSAYSLILFTIFFLLKLWQDFLENLKKMQSHDLILFVGQNIFVREKSKKKIIH